MLKNKGVLDKSIVISNDNFIVDNQNGLPKNHKLRVNLKVMKMINL